MADGSPKPAEEEYVQQLLEALNSPPVPPEMMRVHDPQEVPMPRSERDRLRMIESMVRLVHLDERRSDLEMKIVRKYAAAWRIDTSAVDEFDRKYGKKRSSGLKRLWPFKRR